MYNINDPESTAPYLTPGSSVQSQQAYGMPTDENLGYEGPSPQISNPQEMAQASQNYGASFDGLNDQFATALHAMLEKAGGRIWINSGYRSNDRQWGLWNQAVAKYGSEAAASKWVAHPRDANHHGSNHEYGIAADLGGDLNLAHALAPEFGLTFPMSWEAWHIEPVWARNVQGANYGQTQTTPPSTPGGPTPAPDPYGSFANQLYIFGELAKGTTPEALASQFNTAGAGQTTSGAAQDQAGTSSSGGGTTGKTTPSALYQALRAQGLDAPHAAAFVAVAGRETGGSYDASSHNPDRSTGDDSYGLFQVNKLNGMHPQYSTQSLMTLEGSAAAAADMYKTSGTQPWGPYKGMSWLEGTQSWWDTAAAASGGEVTAKQIQDLWGEGL